MFQSVIKASYKFVLSGKIKFHYKIFIRFLKVRKIKDRKVSQKRSLVVVGIQLAPGFQRLTRQMPAF